MNIFHSYKLMAIGEEINYFRKKRHICLFLMIIMPMISIIKTFQFYYFHFISRVKSAFHRIVKICEGGMIAGEIFQPSLRDEYLCARCLERAKKERGISSPLSLRTALVHKSRSRGRSVRAILGGLKLLGREQSANRSNTQI